MVRGGTGDPGAHEPGSGEDADGGSVDFTKYSPSGPYHHLFAAFEMAPGGSFYSDPTSVDATLDVGALGNPDLTIGEDGAFKPPVNMHIAGKDEVAPDEAFRSQLGPWGSG